METLKQMFLDDPTSVYVVLAIAELFLIVVWFYRRTRLSQRLLLAPLVLAVGVVALDHFVVTDREKIVATAQAMAADFEAGRMSDIGQYIDEGYVGYPDNASKADVVTRLNMEQQSRNVASISVQDVDIDVNGRIATMSLTTIVRLSGQYTGSFALRWRINWVERDGVWRIRGAEPPQQTVPGFGL